MPSNRAHDSGRNRRVPAVPPEIPPGVQPGEVPAFHLLGEYYFQDLCRDLLEEQERISTCTIYGVRGERQDGVDLLAHRANGDGVEVGQCKAYRDFEPAKIREASDEFLAHWETQWRKQDVRRFILFVAGSLDTTRRQQEVITQAARFRELGITYEAWSGSTIRNRLGPHKAIVARYFAHHREYWVRQICGEELIPIAVVSGAQQPSPSVTLLMDNFDLLAASLSGEIRRRLEDMRERWREGAQEEVGEWITGLRGDRGAWNSLSPDVGAGVLRFEASTELTGRGDVERAKSLADQAADLDPSGDERTLRALIAFRCGDTEGALSKLDGVQTTATRNLAAAVQLTRGNLDQVRTVLDLVTDPNAETHRLRALLRLLERDTPQARLAVQKAFAVAPRWTAVQHTAGVVSYYSALSTVAIPSELGGWPEPVDWLLVRRDDQSVARLREAAALFTKLIQEEPIEEERRELEAWRLACLACDAEQQNVAIEYARDLLADSLSHFRVMAWAVARRWPVDVSAGEAAIERSIREGAASVEAVAALVAIYLTTGRRSKAATLLARARDLFDTSHAGETWRLLNAQASQPRAGKLDPRATFTSDADRAAHLAALRSAASKRGGQRRLAEALQVAYYSTDNVRYLLERQQILASIPDWPRAADDAEILIARVATADAVGIAAYATYNAHRPQLCLDILDQQRNSFPGSTLPIELRQLRAAALRSSGMLPEAIGEAEQLVQDDPTTANRMHLVQLYLREGDLASLIVQARALLRAPDLSRENAVWLSARVRSESLSLARDLWRRAANGTPPEGIVPPLVELAFQLGLEDVAAPLVERMQSLAGQGQTTVRAIGIHELVKMVQEWYDEREKTLRAYRRAELPIHVVAKGLREPLSTFYERVARLNALAPDPLKQFPVLIRHGTRASPAVSEPSIAGRRLHVDVTALLLANQLGILGPVEQQFAPLYIAPELQLALLDMRDRLAQQQPSRIAAIEEVVRVVESGAAELITADSAGPAACSGTLGRGIDWERLLQLARGGGGYVLDFLPPTRIDDSGPIEVPAWTASTLLSPHRLVDALYALGALTSNQADEARSRMGVGSPSLASEPTPARNSQIYCHANVVETLANAGVLAVACQQFRMYVQSDELQRCRATLESEKELLLERQWLLTLVERIRSGLEAGSYRLVPEQPRVDADSDGGDQGNTEDEKDPATASLLSLLATGLGQDDALWVDDRYTSRFLLAGGGALVAGITDVLDALLKTGAVDEAEHHRLVASLKAANARFIRTRPSELLHHLRQAPLGQEGVPETPPLQTLRRYLAACALQGDMLAGATDSVDHEDWTKHEGSYLLDNARAVTLALLELWQDRSLDEQTRWIKLNGCLMRCTSTTTVSWPPPGLAGLMWRTDTVPGRALRR